MAEAGKGAPDREDTPHIHVVGGLLAVGADGTRSAEQAAEEASGLTDGSIALADQLTDFFEDPDVAERLTALDVVYLIVDDPIMAARAVDDADPTINASPIHALMPMWHNISNAGPPVEAPDIVKPKLAPGWRQRVIAVVDTGIVADDYLPDWVSSSVIRDDEDIERLSGDEVSHGTLVTSILRMVAPTYTVSMTRAATFEPTVLDPPDEKHFAEPFPSTEAHVAAAIHRLIERHRDDDAVEALHLALGGPSFFPRTNKAMVLLSAALDRWREEFPKCAPIFAAAGNAKSTTRFYPAAFRHVRGVAGAAHRGSQVVWDDAGNQSPAPYRDWVDDVAPGAGVQGLSGRSETDAVSWRGSSFATSVATASYVSYGPRQVQGGIAYWPGRDMDYSVVAGLRY